MQLTGVTINIMTLGGLAVAVGRVVDDAIVVLENIYRHRALGEDRLTAAINGPSEVAGAITASTLTTVAVFLPLGFVGGLVSQFFLPFALTVTFALLASLVCALTVVPVLGLLPDPRRQVRGRRRRRADRVDLGPRCTRRSSRFVLRSRWTKLGVVALAAVLFFASAALAPLLPTQFINAGSEKTLVVTVAPPTGASSDAVLAKTIQAETILLADPARRARPDEHPGRGRHELAGLPVRAPGPGRQQRDDDRPAQGRRRRRRDIDAARDVARAGPDRRLRRHGLVRAGSPSDGLNVIVTGQTRRRRRQGDRRRSSRRSPTSPTSSTSRATSSRRRPRSRSRSTRTRRSPSG